MSSDAPFIPSPDAAKWIRTGHENAVRDLDKFEAIAADLKGNERKGHPLLATHLKALEAQINEAAANNQKLVPTIEGIIGKINGMLTDPGILKRLALKAFVAYVDGKRDNQSYYVLDGAQMWAEKRLDILSKRSDSEPIVGDLVSDLKSVQAKTVLVRDQLDGMAQPFVTGIKKIHTMTGDICGNLEELQKTAKEMTSISKVKDSFLKNSDDLRTQAKDLVNKYQ